MIEVLSQHVKELDLHDGLDDPHQLVTVRRRHIWDDIKRCFQKPYTKHTLPLKVIFVGEPAADQGGPRREFFRLALAASIGDPTLFSGSASKRVPVHNTSALLEKHYLFVGYLISMSIVQGGPGPACFAGLVYDYLAYGLESQEISIDDLPSDSTRELLQEVIELCAIHNSLYLFLFAIMFIFRFCNT